MIFSSLISFTASVPTTRNTGVLVSLTSLKVRSSCVTLYVAAEDGLGASVGDLGRADVPSRVKTHESRV